MTVTTKQNSWYYLHTNGSLIHKKFRPDSDSPFVRAVWPVDLQHRETGWILLVEALALGVDLQRIKYLAKLWSFDAKDLVEFICRVDKLTPNRIRGIRLFLKNVLDMDPDEYYDLLKNTPSNEEFDFSKVSKPKSD